MTMVIQIFFGLLDLASLVVCAWMLVRSIPSDREESRWKKAIGWIGYASATILLPALWQDDKLTIGVLCIYYVVMARLLYFGAGRGSCIKSSSA